jgi:endonuclease YncB( thermonuclease family)
MKWLLILLLVMLFFGGFATVVSGAPDEVVGRVVSVVSGNAFGIEMLTPDARVKNIDSVLLADVVSPSTVTPEGKKAREYSNAMLKNKTVYLDIDDNSTGGRNEWSQLICVMYLMDSDYRPVWPSFNRILVDSGNGVLKDDKKNEFNASSWWQEAPAAFTAKAKWTSEKESANRVDVGVLTRAAGLGNSLKTDAKSAQTQIMPSDPNSTSVLKKDARSGAVSIGYR